MRGARPTSTTRHHRNRDALPGSALDQVIGWLQLTGFILHMEFDRQPRGFARKPARPSLGGRPSPVGTEVKVLADYDPGAILIDDAIMHFVQGRSLTRSCAGGGCTLCGARWPDLPVEILIPSAKMGMNNRGAPGSSARERRLCSRR